MRIRCGLGAAQLNNSSVVGTAAVDFGEDLQKEGDEAKVIEAVD